MLKKTMMLAMAAAVVAAFAVPATATANEWKHGAVNIVGNKQIDLTGQALFHSGVVGGIECQTTAQLTALAGSGGTGNVTKFDTDLDEAGSTVTTKCKATGFLAGCQVHATQSTGTGGGTLLANPWVVHNPTTKAVEVTSGDIHISMTGGFCPGDTATVTPATLTATPNQPKNITSFALSGQVQVHILKNGVTQTTSTATVSGTQTIVDTGVGSQSRPHTYGLE
jgi:hypothetical protein